MPDTTMKRDVHNEDIIDCTQALPSMRGRKASTHRRSSSSCVSAQSSSITTSSPSVPEVDSAHVRRSSSTIWIPSSITSSECWGSGCWPTAKSSSSSALRFASYNVHVNDAIQQREEKLGPTLTTFSGKLASWATWIPKLWSETPGIRGQHVCRDESG